MNNEKKVWHSNANDNMFGLAVSFPGLHAPRMNELSLIHSSHATKNPRLHKPMKEADLQEFEELKEISISTWRKYRRFEK